MASKCKPMPESRRARSKSAQTTHVSLNTLLLLFLAGVLMPRVGNSQTVVIPAEKAAGRLSANRGDGLSGEFYDTGHRMTSLTGAVHWKTTHDPTSTFVSRSVDYPKGWTDYVADSTRLSTYLGSDASTLRGPGNIGLEGSVFVFTGFIAIRQEYDQNTADNDIDVTFTVGSDDGFRLRIGGRTVASHSQEREYGETTGTASFESEGLYPVDLLYYEDETETGIEWTSSITGGIVPTTVLSTSPLEDLKELELSSSLGGSVITPGEGTFAYSWNTPVQIEAAPSDACYFIFDRWTGTAVDMGEVQDETSASLTLCMDADYTLRAHFLSVLDVIHVDDDGALDPGPGNLALSDPDENGTIEHPFDSVQEAIDAAMPASTVLVHEGRYVEGIDLKRKSIRVMADWLIDPAVASPAIIDADGQGRAVVFATGEDIDCIIQGFVLECGRADTGAAVLCRQSSPLIANCLVCGNRATAQAGAAIVCENGNPVFLNCTISGNAVEANGAIASITDSNAVFLNSIIWDNKNALPFHVVSGSISEILFCNIQGGVTDVGNLDADPLFAYPGYWDHNGTPSIADDDVWIDGDYHLLSTQGRYSPLDAVWVTDDADSLCVDAGDPFSSWNGEPWPHGNHINLGFYGGTTQASKSRPRTHGASDLNGF